MAINAIEITTFSEGLETALAYASGTVSCELGTYRLKRLGLVPIRSNTQQGTDMFVVQ
jgi:hypothetical protein